MRSSFKINRASFLFFFYFPIRAVIHDRPECVEVLMAAHADPNVAFMGDTPLSIAARHNRRKIVQ